MSTPSCIAIEAEGITAVYCHSNGFPTGPYGVGHRLLNHYPDPPSIRKLLAGGDISSIGTSVGEELTDHYAYQKRVFLDEPTPDHQTIYYRRDYGRPASECQPLRCAERCDLERRIAGTGVAYAYLYTAEDGWLFSHVPEERDERTEPFDWQPLTEETVREGQQP